MKDLDQAIEHVTPWLETLEAQRMAAVARFRKSVIFGLIGAVLAAAGLGAFGLEVGFMALGAILVASGTMVWGGLPMSALSKVVKTGLNDRFAEAFGMRYSETVSAPARYDAFKAHGLIPNSDRRSFEDQFSGAYDGADFDIYEAHLEQRRRTKNRTYYVTVFRGVLIRINFPRTVEGVTLVTRDKGWFNGLEGWEKSLFGGRKLERVGLVDPTFEKAFEVYGTDQVMARYLLTPSFMERLLKLETVLKGKNVRCVFDEALGAGAGQGELLIAAETGNKFEAGSMFKPLLDRDRIAKLHGEFALIEDIIATVLEPARDGGGVN